MLRGLFKIDHKRLRPVIPERDGIVVAIVVVVIVIIVVVVVVAVVKYLLFILIISFSTPTPVYEPLCMGVFVRMAEKH